MGDTTEVTMDLFYEMNKDWIYGMQDLKMMRWSAYLLMEAGEIPGVPPPGDQRQVMMTRDEARHIHELLHHSIWGEPNPQPAIFRDLLGAMRTVAEDHLVRLDREIEALESELDVGKEQE